MKRGISICRNVLERAVSLTRAVLQRFNLFFIIFLFGVLLITQQVYADKLNSDYCYGQSTSVCAYYDYKYDASLRDRVIPCHSCCNIDSDRQACDDWDPHSCPGRNGLPDVSWTWGSCCCDSPNNPTHYGDICREYDRAGAGCAPPGWCKDNSDIRNGVVYNCAAGETCTTDRTCYSTSPSGGTPTAPSAPAPTNPSIGSGTNLHDVYDGDVIRIRVLNADCRSSYTGSLTGNIGGWYATRDDSVDWIFKAQGYDKNGFRESWECDQWTGFLCSNCENDDCTRFDRYGRSLGLWIAVHDKNPYQTKVIAQSMQSYPYPNEQGAQHVLKDFSTGYWELGADGGNFQNPPASGWAEEWFAQIDTNSLIWWVDVCVKDPSETSCSDGVDNDGDGSTDCGDSECANTLVCCPTGGTADGTFRCPVAKTCTADSSLDELIAVDDVWCTENIHDNIRVKSGGFIVPGSTLNDYWEGDSCSDTDGKTSDLIGEKKIYIDDINRYPTISAMVGIDDDSFVWIDKGAGYREVTGLHRTCCGWTNWVDLKPFLRTGWNTLKFKAVDSCSGGRNFNMDWGIQTCIPNGSSAAGACCSGLSRCADNVCRSSCSCNDNNLCTTSSAYDAQGNCAATAYTSGGAYCDDGNANTVKDACNGAGT